MFFKQFVNEDLGCASYVIGDTNAGECVVVDPGWDVTPYLELASGKGMAIRYVIETHNHADHISGHGKLAKLGAQVAVHEEAGVSYPHKPLADGEALKIGGVELRVMHTPGHRPEHIALTVTDTSRAAQPWLVLTGDSMFVGDVGRPDLAVEPGEGAALLFTSLSNLLELEDGVEVYPGHVSGSLCGRSMSPKPNSTIGFERRHNAPLTEKEQGAFVRRVTSELPPQPPQFARIVEKNKGPFLTDDAVVRALTADEVDALRKDRGFVLDTREPEAFGGGHIPGAINVDLHGGQFATRASWVIPEGVPVALVLSVAGDLKQAMSLLEAVGQSNIKGYLLGGMHAWDSSGRPIEAVPQVPVSELRERLQSGDRSFTVLDVREDSEWSEGHIDGAVHIPFHQLRKNLDLVPSHKPVAVVCGGGTRSSIAASLLQGEGFDPMNVSGGMGAWNSSGYPLAHDSQSIGAEADAAR